MRRAPGAARRAAEPLPCWAVRAQGARRACPGQRQHCNTVCAAQGLRARGLSAHTARGRRRCNDETTHQAASLRAPVAAEEVLEHLEARGREEVVGEHAHERRDLLVDLRILRLGDLVPVHGEAGAGEQRRLELMEARVDAAELLQACSERRAGGAGYLWLRAAGPHSLIGPAIGPEGSERGSARRWLRAAGPPAGLSCGCHRPGVAASGGSPCTAMP